MAAGMAPGRSRPPLIARAATSLAIASAMAWGSTPALAQLNGAHWEFSPVAGYTILDQGFQPYGIQKLKDNLYLGGRVGYLFMSYAGLEVAAGYTPTRETSPGTRTAGFGHLSGDLLIYPFGQTRVSPFVLAGGGGSMFQLTGQPTRRSGQGNAGAGVRFWINDAVALRVEARDVFARDLVLSPGFINNVSIAGGLTVGFGGGSEDADGDGVPDRKDRCPGTTFGCQVDGRGCPLDSDGDGICDGLDRCPNTPKGARVDASGCPTDSDGDGVPDGIDQCPNTPVGTPVDARGCPLDADGDGVPDNLDKCPDTPRGCTVDARGCPLDSDHDGVCDGLDKCPNTARGCTVDANGCPVDSDHDGVCDDLDKCPNTPAGAAVNDEGCPSPALELGTELLQTGTIILEDLSFATGSARLLPESQAELNLAGQVLAKWPQLILEVGGHTDSRGTVEANRRLSEARARTVRDYLVARFRPLTREHLTVKGYGASRPLSPNTTLTNMARNRRVEITVLNREVLEKELEKRRKP